MKKIMLLMAVVSVISFTSCNKDDDGGDDKAADGCVSCTTEGTPAVEVCKGDNGNAIVNGQDTGFEYDGYISLLKIGGGTCK